jgi:hypothetical protein
MALATLPEGWTRIPTAEWERNLHLAYMVDMIQSQYIHQMNIRPIHPLRATPQRTAPIIHPYYTDINDASDATPPENDLLDNHHDTEDSSDAEDSSDVEAENNSLENYPDTEDSSDIETEYYLLTRSETGPPDNDVCGICLENDETPFSEGWAVLQSCGHMFHYPCIIKALEFRTRCPLCRTWVGHWA